MFESFPVILWSAVFLDLLFGDPRWFPHPVRLIGGLAVRLETWTRRLPLSARGSGCLTVALVLLSTAATVLLICLFLRRLSPAALSGGAVCILYTTIAARDLVRHAQAVHDSLGLDLDQARRAVSMIVGRDTDSLDEAGIVRACVESVAENLSDGIIAPLFWAVVGAVAALPAGGAWPVICGVCAAMVYKGINTMDSMFGYKNEQYRRFGTCAARLDDAANFFPARLSGLAIVAAAPLCGADRRRAWEVLRRDHARHASPNAGWPEAAMAGALGLQLGGESRYFGTLSVKPLLGENIQTAVPDHIIRANVLVSAASLLCLVLVTVLFVLSRILFS
jgi:adenosylcobinamide-phosphate synthase